MGLNDIIRPKSPDEIKDLEERGFQKGSGKWKFRIDIAKIVSNFDKNEDAEEFRSGIVEMLQSKIEDIKILKGDKSIDKYEDLIGRFRVLNNPDAEELDDILRELYDWADENDVWIESF
jgi:nucleoside diphosphate kinase